MIQEKKPRKKPTARGHLFKKGQSGNPNGRPKIDPELKHFRELTYKEFINQLQKYGWQTPDQIKQDLERTDVTMFERIFGKIILQAADGEKDGRQVFLERLWGKVKDQVEVMQTSTNSEAEELLKKIPMAELVALAKKYEKDAKEDPSA